ncbi:MAG: hypothetical protein AABY15_06010 [Nanoarchaeota archaeon]
MRFEELTEDSISKIKEIYSSKDLSWDERMSNLMDHLGKSERTVRKWLVKLGFKEKVQEDSPQYVNAKKKKISKNAKRYIFTWAQNNTPIHEEFLRNLEAYAKYIDATIYIIAGRYKNPTSVFSDEEFESWHSRTEPYLYANREQIHKHLVIIGDVKVSPTAVTPMTGMKGFSGSESCIFGHPKAQEETVEVLEGRPEKKMMTTGACTIPNYTDSKAGKKGEFHHTLGFVIAEIKDKNTVFTRCVTAADDGNFYDLYFQVEFVGGRKKKAKVSDSEEIDFYANELDGKSIITKIKEVDGIILGDMHFGEHDEKVIDSTLNILLKKLKPKEVVLHDVFDGHSISHHDRKDPFKQYQKEVRGKNNLKNEVDVMLEGLKPFEKYKTIIVRSNHDDFLDRWLRDIDWKKEIKNAPEYMEYALLLLKEQAPKGVIPYVINQKYPNMITLGRSDSYRIHEWEVGQHGDIGAGGSRGSINQYRQLNTKMIVGHSHAPSRKDGVIQVGTSTKLRLGYNVGPSKWGHAHAIIHPNGKGQLIYLQNGEFTTFE